MPLGLSEGRSGATPQVTLGSDSGKGNGVFGYGWSIPLLAISRRTDRRVLRYDYNDTFVRADTEDLLHLLEADRDWAPAHPRYQRAGAARYRIERFRPRVAATPLLPKKWTGVDGTGHWRSISRDNVATLYGATAASRIAGPTDPTRILTWRISETRDDRGNAIWYGYGDEDESGVDRSQPHELGRDAAARTTARHLKQIRYGDRTPAVPADDLQARSDWMFDVVLDYGDHDSARPAPPSDRPSDVRADQFSSYRSGFEVRTYRLCRRVLIFHPFSDEPGVGSNCLVRATKLHFRAEGQGSFPPTPTRAGFERDGTTHRRVPLSAVVYPYTPLALDGTRWPTDPPDSVDRRISRWIDLDGGGLPGVLTEQDGAWFYQRNESTPGAAAFGPARLVSQRPASSDLGPGRQQLAHLAGDGRLDLLVLGAGQDGFFERDGEGWTALTPFTSAPVLSWHDPNLRFADLTWDGLADLLVTGDDAHRWYASLGEQGFAAVQPTGTGRDEDDGPRVVFADGTHTVQLADLSGDGLVDLVRVRHDEVSYWPNLGYGRFGRGIRMSGAPDLGPPELFDAGLVRLADVGGTGPADLVYLGRDGVTICLNESGNGMAALPDNVTDVQVADLLGTGTACLVWSWLLPGDAGRPVRYADLRGGVKPHLLTEVRNILGARVRIAHIPSTQFLLEARAAGTPWLSTIPFPVHAGERVTTEDLVSHTVVVSRCAYHHPNFDGADREFRGLALVEQWDTEEFDGRAGPPAVRVRMWFHTGAPDGGIEALLPAGQYDDVDMPDSLYPTDVRVPGRGRRAHTLDEAERLEAAQRLKGLQRRVCPSGRPRVRRGAGAHGPGTRRDAGCRDD